MAGMDVTLGLEAQEEMTQERVFVRCYLPLTVALAAHCAREIRPQLGNTPASWPYVDRAIAWLIPVFRTDVEKFHRGNGPDLADMY